MTAVEAPAGGPRHLDVSIVIPTCGRPQLLERCLMALLAQTLARERFEIIVVDDGHDSRCRDRVHAIAALEGAPRLRYLCPIRGKGPAVARNCGWRAATAPVVAFTDDDTRPETGWLRLGLTAMARHPEWVAASGRVRVPPVTRRRRGVHRAPTDHEWMTRGLETAEFVTANAFVRRAALATIDGFDERFRRPWREDSDLQFRLETLGPVGHATRALVWHPVRPERWGVSLRQQRNVFFDALLYRKHPALYRSRIRRVPPWDYYAIVASTLVAAAMAGTGLIGAATMPMAGALVLVLRLAAQRLLHTSRAPAHVAEMLCTSAAIPFLSVYWRLRGAWHFRTPFL